MNYPVYLFIFFGFSLLFLNKKYYSYLLCVSESRDAETSVFSYYILKAMKIDGKCNYGAKRRTFKKRRFLEVIIYLIKFPTFKATSVEFKCLACKMQANPNGWKIGILKGKEDIHDFDGILDLVCGNIYPGVKCVIMAW